MINHYGVVRNNLFDYATSELSHDAILCWLLNSKNGGDFILETVSLSLFNKMLNTNYQTIDSVKVDKQVALKSVMKENDKAKPITGTLDIVVDVILDNHQYLLVIEDKVNTYETNNQLDRYPILVQGNYDLRNKIVKYIFVTLGTKPTPLLRQITENTQWNVINRDGILTCIEEKQQEGLIINEILAHYYSYLKSWTAESIMFKEDSLYNWSSKAIQGFYEYIGESNQITDVTTHDANWGYVYNYNGGFWGFWWNFSHCQWCDGALKTIQQDTNRYKDFSIYLQLELTSRTSAEQSCAIKIGFKSDIIENKNAYSA
ncbi:MAG: PD-(D/E)XK nuclease family protein [Erysipelotrichaceae bacterium]|nr:PD-(D/E)XK nuclease family protein [Erysipelotrichaceae bacterium]